MKTLILYKNDIKSWFTAGMIANATPDVVLQQHDGSDLPPALVSCDLFLVGFCFEQRDIIEMLAGYAGRVFVFHADDKTQVIAKSAWCPDNLFFPVTNELPLGVATWEYLHPSANIPAAVYYVEDVPHSSMVIDNSLLLELLEKHRSGLGADSRKHRDAVGRLINDPAVLLSF